MINNEKKPDFFNEEWYISQKKLKKTDVLIASELNVTSRSVSNWKRNLELSGMKMQRGKLEKPIFFNKEWYTKQKEFGKNDEEIAWEMSVSITPFKRWKKELGF